MKVLPTLINSAAIIILAISVIGVKIMAEKVQCPNCLEPAEKTGNKITCVACDSVLTVTRTGGAKLADAGWKEKLESRVETLEGLLSPEELPEVEADAAADAAADGEFLED